jgi:hypothetical protein
MTIDAAQAAITALCPCMDSSTQARQVRRILSDLYDTARETGIAEGMEVTHDC